MTVRRLVLTGAVMGLAAVTLAALTPETTAMTGALSAPQRTVDTAGADALVLAAAGLLAWVVWAWGALGLALTAASALPGALGGAARLATQVVLPAGARRGAALVLGLGLGVAAPLTGVAVTVMAPPAAAAPAATAAPADAVPDWPDRAAPVGAPAPAQVPDWPADLALPATDGTHVVVRGDCLWHIASSWLTTRAGGPPTDVEVAQAVQAWWAANADVIGPDPDLLLPGQVLRASEGS